MVCKKLTGSSKETCVAAIITGLKDHLRAIGWPNLTIVGISCEEEATEWTADDCENICDNITSKGLKPESVLIARREELEIMDKPAVLKDVEVEHIKSRWASSVTTSSV